MASKQKGFKFLQQRVFSAKPKYCKGYFAYLKGYVIKSNTTRMNFKYVQGFKPEISFIRKRLKLFKHKNLIGEQLFCNRLAKNF